MSEVRSVEYVPPRPFVLPERPYRVFTDGAAWCATGPGFINLQESNAGFGELPAEALVKLIAADARAEQRRREGIRQWHCTCCRKTFERGTPEDRAPCPRCSAGAQYTYEVQP
jgi:hypothetical protein